MSSLLDQHCPEAHSAPITAAAYDPKSGASITADESGVIAITRGGEDHPNLIFQPGDRIYGAVAVSQGGSLVACGDEAGSVYVFKAWDGQCVFQDVKEGPEGQTRAMRAMCFNHLGTILATLAADGIVRVFDIQRWERIANYQGYGGEAITFDAVSERLLVVDTLGQPKLIDMMSAEMIDLEMVPGGVRRALFTPDCSHVVCMGQGGLTLIELPDGKIVNSFTAKGSSGMLSITVSPDGDLLGAVTGRSVHVFTLPDLQPHSSEQHGAENPTPVALWDARGVAVGGADGGMHRPGAGGGSLPPILAVSGFGYHRVAAHGERVAVWHKNRRKRPFNAKRTFVELRVDRDGHLLAGLPNDGAGVQIFQAHTGKHLFDAGPDTADTPKMEVGGHIFAAMLPNGGMRWYDIKNNSVLELPWVQNFALSGGGTWIAAITPKGRVKVLDPATGQDAIPAPEPLADVPISLVSFVNRRPDMLVMDDEGVLGMYDLTDSVKDQVPARGQDVLDLNVEVDRLWGVTGGEFAAVRFQEPEKGTATVIFVDVKKGEVVSEVPNLLPYVWVDPETGTVLQPARGNAILELDMYGREHRVLRSLPEGAWICFDPNGILDDSTQETAE